MEYTDKVMQNFQNPQNVGKMEDANAIGLVGGEVCGDIMKIYLKIEDNIIKKATFETFGCASAIASSSMATQMLIGKTIDEALNLTNKEVVEQLEGLPPQKIHCSVMVEEAVKAAIENYKNNK